MNSPVNVLFIIAIAFKWASVGPPAEWSWWLIAGAWFCTLMLLTSLSTWASAVLAERGSTP